MVGPYYTAIGGVRHVDGGVPDPATVLAGLGHDRALAEAAGDTSWDDVIRADGDAALPARAATSARRSSRSTRPTGRRSSAL